jgi:DNA-binding response OmpR family regulator
MLHNKSCVLLIEDDPRILRLEQMVLEKEGYTVLAAGTGEEALETLAELSPSLIVLDIGLPGMNGFTACYQIREVSQVPIIMVTGRGFDEDKIKGLEIGRMITSPSPFPPMNCPLGSRRPSAARS